MFRSKAQPLIFPQSEHLRLVGAIALHWGNDQFDRPELPFDSFAMGVALHDWGHGFFDTNEIGAMDNETRVRSMGNLAHAHLPDPIAETIMQFHALRLMGTEPLYDELRPILDKRIEANLERMGIARAPFEWADRITNLVDMISFDFCFGEPIRSGEPVFATLADQEQTEVTYEIDPNGRITLDPWPLSVASLSGYILGYQADQYPEKQMPTMIRYEIGSV